MGYVSLPLADDWPTSVEIPLAFVIKLNKTNKQPPRQRSMTAFSSPGSPYTLCCSNSQFLSCPWFAHFSLIFFNTGCIPLFAPPWQSMPLIFIGSRPWTWVMLPQVDLWWLRRNGCPRSFEQVVRPRKGLPCSESCMQIMSICFKNC